MTFCQIFEVASRVQQKVVDHRLLTIEKCSVQEKKSTVFCFHYILWNAFLVLVTSPICQNILCKCMCIFRWISSCTLAMKLYPLVPGWATHSMDVLMYVLMYVLKQSHLAVRIDGVLYCFEAWLDEQIASIEIVSDGHLKGMSNIILACRPNIF